MGSAMDVYLGIDPGLQGGFATITVTARGRKPQAMAMPATERDVWLLVRGIATQLVNGLPILTSDAEAIEAIEVRAVIERVHAMPKQGVSSTFKFGVSYGGLRMALIAAGIPFEEVAPRTWQKAVGISPKNESRTVWKNRLRAKAQQLFPRVDVTLKTADALLIAEYCLRKHTGTLIK